LLETHQPDQIAKTLDTLREILTDYYAVPDSRPVLDYHGKEEMIEAFDQPEPPREGLGLEGAITLFRDKVLPVSVKTWHPKFVNQMFPGATMPALLAELFASMMNPTMATWEMSPAATIIERNVTRWMAGIMGMPEGSGGILLPGGSLSNLLALTVARNLKLDKRIATEGMANAPRGAILCSDASHYSVANAANMLGIGADQVIKVATNERNEMLVDAFRAEVEGCKERGLRPFAAVATMGITVTGGFDPLEDMVPICKEHDIHLHVDAAFGGSMALTERGSAYFRGIEHADTAIWDAHKWMHVPLTCTGLMAPNPQIFKQVFSSNANYLFHPREDDLDMADDLGQYTILCGKRFDGLCMWFLLQAFGEDAYRQMTETRLETAFRVTEMIDADPDFQMSYVIKSPLLCFRFMPEEVQGTTLAYRDRLQRYIRETSKQRGDAYFNIAKLKGEDHIRMILINQLTTLDHVREMLEGMRTLGRAFIAENPPERA